MSTFSIEDRFKNYAWFSTQVDQYFAAIRIYARNHETFRAIYKLIPKELSQGNLNLDRIDEDLRTFVMTTSSSFNYMSTTGIFKDAPFPELKDLPNDMINFGFYTCFCFQWTLFENFVKESLLYLANNNFLPNEVSNELIGFKYRTAKFLKYIDSGMVFGQSPFETVLPIKGWEFKTEECDYQDLDKIRQLRNKFIHAIKGREILHISEHEKEKLYTRSMWIMRNFGSNIRQEVMNLEKLKQK